MRYRYRQFLIAAAMIVTALICVSALQRVRDFVTLPAAVFAMITAGLLASLAGLRRAAGADPAAAFGG